MALFAAIGFATVVAPGGGAIAPRDDTDWLQAKLDKGGKIFLPKLPSGDCYQTRGLWVSRSGTRIGSSGACIVYLGPGPVRLHSSDGDPMPSNAIFFINRDSKKGMPPRSVVISDLTLLVPIGTEGYGVVVAGREVTLANLTIDGVPIDGVTVTGRGNGLGYAGIVKIRNTIIRGAQRERDLGHLRRGRLDRREHDQRRRADRDDEPGARPVGRDRRRAGRRHVPDPGASGSRATRSRATPAPGC